MLNVESEMNNSRNGPQANSTEMDCATTFPGEVGRLRTWKLNVALRALPHGVGEHGTEVVGAGGEHHAMRLRFKRCLIKVLI